MKLINGEWHYDSLVSWEQTKEAEAMVDKLQAELDGLEERRVTNMRAIRAERDQLRAAINGMSEAFELEKEQARYFKNRAGYLWAVLKEIRDLARTVGNKTPRAQAPELCARIATLAEEALK